MPARLRIDVFHLPAHRRANIRQHDEIAVRLHRPFLRTLNGFVPCFPHRHVVFQPNRRRGEIPDFNDTKFLDTHVFF